MVVKYGVSLKSMETLKIAFNDELCRLSVCCTRYMLHAKKFCAVHLYSFVFGLGSGRILEDTFIPVDILTCVAFLVLYRFSRTCVCIL